MDNKKVALGAAGVALAGAVTLGALIPNKKPVQPPTEGCQYIVVAQDADGSEHDMTEKRALCPDKVMYKGRTYWFAAHDFKNKKMIYREHTKPVPKTAQAPVPKPEKPKPKARPIDELLKSQKSTPH
jgi:hypothetical protein